LEKHGAKPAQANSSQDSILKRPQKKRKGEKKKVEYWYGMVEGVGPEFKP
jgi:hypothetical protein